MSETSSHPTSPLARALTASLALLLLVAHAPFASAQTQQEREERARALFMEGRQYWEQERWEEAGQVWLEAYEAHSLPLILYNVAHAFREQGNCSAALYFYERYVRDDPGSQHEAEAAQIIETLASECEPRPPWADPEPVPEPDPGMEQPEPGSGTEQPEPDLGPEQPEPDLSAEPIRSPMLTGFAEVGPAFISLGELDVPVLTSVRAGIAYPIAAGGIEVQPGAVTTFTPIPWSSGGGSESGTALLTGLLANAAARVPVADKLFARGEFGLGVLIFSGVAGEGSVFVEPGQTATGALGMFHMRAQLAAEYEVTPNLAISLSPLALSHSPRRKGLKEDIGSLTRFEILAGLSVRL